MVEATEDAPRRGRGRTDAAARAEGRRAHRRNRSRGLLTQGAHLAVLSSFAFAQPLFDLLGKNAEFFAARGSTSADIVLFALAVTLVPPAGLLLVEAIAGLVHERLEAGLHLVFVAALAALVALQALKRPLDLPAAALLALAAAAGVAVAAAVARTRVARAFLAVLAPAPVVFVLLFLFATPVKKLVLVPEEKAAAANVASRAPVVMVVFDELPEISLLNRRRRIDAARFPGFARLARGSTWFRNTTTVTGQTTKAVPAILTGRYPRQGRLPVFSDHPRNLFTLFGRSYDLEVSESITRLCPTDLCRRAREPAGERISFLASDLGVVYLHLLLPEDLAERLPSVSDNWMGFREEGGDADAAARPRTNRTPEKRTGGTKDRDLQVERFIESIRPRSRPTLYFLHVLLPHRPWTYLPSGKDYGNRDVRTFAQQPNGLWTTDRMLLAHAYQRYLLQLGFVDRMVQALIRRLHATELWDESLLVVTADHGVSIRAGGAGRGVRPSTAAEIGPVPLFVKKPGQRRGRVVDRDVQTIDILPGIADALGIRIPWKVEGRSARDGRLDRRTLTIDGGFRAEGAELERAKYASLRERLRVFGAGGGALRVFRIGPYGALVGRPLAPLLSRGAPPARATVEHPDWYRSVETRSRFAPSFVRGRLAGGEAGVHLAVAVNGRIGAVARSFEYRGAVRYAAMVPDSLFREGRNRIDVLAVVGRGRSVRLLRLGGV